MPNKSALLLAAALAVAAGSAYAQAWREPQTGFPDARDWPMPKPQQQTAPAEQPTGTPAPDPEPGPAAPGAASTAKKKATKSAAAPAASAPREAAVNPAPAGARTINCAGVFARTSNHLQLAMAFNSRNVTYAEVDGPQGSKLMASVVFPKDPKRRLEVWWDNETSRSGTYLIVINGQSTWTAPKGLKLGLQIAQLERLNGKPFKLKGFGSSNEGSVSDWQGGALESIAGGCKVGVSMRADAKAPPNAIELAAAELASTDAAVKTIKPAVTEIIIGY